MKWELSRTTVLLLGFVLAWWLFRFAITLLFGYVAVKMTSVKHPTLPIGQVPFRKRLRRLQRIPALLWILFVSSILIGKERAMYGRSDDSLWSLVYFLYYKGLFGPSVAVAFVFATAFNPLVGYFGGLLAITFVTYGFVWWLTGFFIGPYKKDRRNDLANTLALYAYVAWFVPYYYGKKAASWLLANYRVTLMALLLAAGFLVGPARLLVPVILGLVFWLTSWLIRLALDGLFRLMCIAPGYLRPIYRFGFVPLGHALRYFGELLLGSDWSLPKLETIEMGMTTRNGSKVPNPEAVLQSENRCEGCGRPLLAMMAASQMDYGGGIGVGLIVDPCEGCEVRTNRNKREEVA